MNKIDKLIDVNLRILYNSPGTSIMTADLEDPERVDLTLFDAKNIAQTLEKENLLTLRVEVCNITSFGIEVSEDGGWIEYKKNKLREAREKENDAKFKNDREMDLLKLQTENLMYQRRNRKLEIQRYWIGIGATILGSVLGSVFL